MSEQIPPVPPSASFPVSAPAPAGDRERPRNCLFGPWHPFTVRVAGLVLRRSDQHCRSRAGFPGREKHPGKVWQLPASSFLASACCLTIVFVILSLVSGPIIQQLQNQIISNMGY